MRKRWIGWIGVIALAIAPAAMGQTEQPQPAQEPSLQERTMETRTITGRVVQVDRNSLIVETTAGQRMTFAVDRDLTTGAQPIRVGDQVRVEYRGETDLRVVSVNPVSDPGRETADVDRERTGATAQTRARTDVDDDGFETAPAARALPATASPLPLLLITGISLLGGGLALSARRRR